MRSKSVPVNLLIRKIHTALGEGGEEGSPEEGDDKAEGEEEAGSMTPTNSASPAPVEGSPPLDALSPGSLHDDPTLNREPSRCNSHESGDMLFPGGVALPPSMPALLPSQMAAYLNAAAHAVQSHRLMMTSPLPSSFGRAAVSPLISSTSSPPSCELSPTAEGILDFSRKRPEGATSGAPLDLSVGSRKRAAEEMLPQPPQRKAKPSAPAWPYFMTGLSPKGTAPDLWNGKAKPAAPSEAAKALEKMSELSKIGGDDLFRMASGVPPSPASNRNSAWQSHWLSKGAEQAKDVLKCVWCKQSFASLAALTTHMKEAKHCGVNIPQPQAPPQLAPPPTSATSTKSPHQSDLNMLIKETMPLPRKLVRGQDVWLGKGAEQTRQILKCMWCGQSFRSLAEMTSHMQQTQHYTNIISQEQIISWRSSDDAKGGGSGTSGSSQAPPGGASSHVSAVLTCKVCDQAFTSLKELSNHMVKNSHYKEHIMRSITESGGRRRQTREKRKKSLPVRKLLELERAHHNGDSLLDKLRDPAAAGRITCEKCANKIETSAFVEHIRQCVGGVGAKNFLKSALLSGDAILPPSDEPKPPKSPTPPDPGSKEPANGSSPSVLNAIEKLIEKSFDSRARQSSGAHGAQPPIGSSILKRLGIDESVDYTKPLVDAQTMSLLRSYHQQRRERSGSESSSLSERGSSRVDSLTPERKMDPPLSVTPRSTPDIKREKSPLAEQPLTIKKEVEEASPVQVKEEEDAKEATPPPSPSSSERSGTPRSTTSERKSEGGSLGALSSMFDNLSGAASAPDSQAGGGGKRASSHPLAALQKLCDKTETHPANSRAHAATVTSAPSTTSVAGTSTTPGAILAFSWACNDAVMTPDSIMKCAFCDTPFISKGAYRHHLSKMHFVKDGVIPDPVAQKAPAPASSSSVGVPLKGTTGAGGNGPPPVPKSPPPAAGGFEESPHSKFLKYTELAKQLSSKYV